LKDLDDRPDPRALLEAFVASNRSEKAFATLVGSLGGLVYTSALRRKQNSQLAEEISQNVFAIMARKADALVRHPSLMAWIFEATRLQSANALRSEKRRQRKLAALASEANTQDAVSSYHIENEASWEDAVPVLDEALDRLPVKEREMVLQRFYEGRKFREIAAQQDQSEAACRMRRRKSWKYSAGKTQLRRSESFPP
jgi:RNA polymerase sigma factor (sigma-70 family)